MYKKSLLSVAVASVLTLTGCLENNKIENRNTGAAQAEKGSIADSAGTYPIFDPGAPALPIPNDLIFDADAGDGSFNVTDSAPPVTTAINGLSGASTVAPIDLEMSGLIADDATMLASSVFLIATEYASGAPVQTLALGEPPTISANQPEYVVEHKILDGKSYIRINPTEPLDPNTRYVVVVTDGVLDASGEPLKQSPGIAGYDTLEDETKAVPNPDLLRVRALINSLWEPIAEGFFNIPVVGVNAQRALASLDPYTEDNIVLSYSFTTSNDERVLDYLAEPSQWIADRITDLVKVGATRAALSGGASDYASVKATVDLGFTNWTAASLNPALAGCDTAFPIADEAATINRINCAASNLYAAFEAGSLGFTADFPDPEATAITMNGAAIDVTVLNPALSTDNGGPIPPGTIVADQGTVTVPYFSGLPVGFPAAPTETTAAAGAGLPLKYNSWTADASLATTLNIAFYCSGLVIPQGFSGPAIDGPDALSCTNGSLTNPADAALFTNAPLSTVVNYIYPFPAKTDEDLEIPLLAIYPAAAGGGTPVKSVMWGHGLRGDRSQALGFGSLLALQGVANATATGGESLNAVIAIDEPLHGVTSGPLEASTFGATERHFGFQDAGAGPTNPPGLVADGGSGSLFINFESFLTARDNNRQHVMDLLTVRKTIPSLTLNGYTLDQEVIYTGHSLGTLNAQAFVAVANNTTTSDDDIDAAAFFTPTGGAPRMFENSPAFAPLLVDGLAANGITPDTYSYQAYLNVFQHAFDTFDAVNFVDRFATQGAPILYFEALNDLAIPVSQAAENRTFQSASTAGNVIAGSVSYLSGAEPLMALSGATALPSSGTTNIGIAVARYQPCVATHGTPSIPGSDAFSENLTHVTQIVSDADLTDGADITPTVNAPSLFQTVTTIPDDLPALDFAPTCKPSNE